MRDHWKKLSSEAQWIDLAASEDSGRNLGCSADAISMKFEVANCQ
jgi:hypothetical protein